MLVLEENCSNNNDGDNNGDNSINDDGCNRANSRAKWKEEVEIH